ncbi:hypothetical protein CO178_02230 [candidate division WWE3 bacterium CG_4_9_14_3_um_filter_34_6]|uniref:4Fe-4S ferredoxin-type domain-containing protein n=1 Tax=candidate division WWE3 bacterium CG_4_9_14_3_um_filter_34_6 TaxID=1975079 RepID=A0A2M7X2T2_UNCKA|nr:MAG: hypothetical protein CO178_02230 [candidate division WWE3 bacterium CG_4_9_14_3_um_filter_34_6]
MANRYLVAPREQKCIGCGLCVLAVTRYEKRQLGTKNSPITIKGFPGQHKIQIDYGEVIKNPKKIVQICPQNCFDTILS